MMDHSQKNNKTKTTKQIMTHNGKRKEEKQTTKNAPKKDTRFPSFFVCFSCVFGCGCCFVIWFLNTHTHTHRQTLFDLTLSLLSWFFFSWDAPRKKKPGFGYINRERERICRLFGIYICVASTHRERGK